MGEIMAKNIEPKLKKIGEYLKLDEDSVFVIPEYQRPYSWDIENCDKLWQDIITFGENKSKDNYFFGTIILSCDSADSRFELIDGQQRTTTFLLLLKALLFGINDKINKISSEDDESSGLLNGLKDRRQKILGVLYKVEPEDIPERPNAQKDCLIYEKLNILINNSNNEKYKDDLNIILKGLNFESIERNVIKIKYRKKDNAYTNFFRNFKFFYNKIMHLQNNEINSIAKSILESCEVIEIRSWKVEQAITMFNSLNSDGMPLNDADIISAKLFASSKCQNKENEYSELWKELLDCVNVLSEKSVLDFNSILTQYMYVLRAKNNEIVSPTGAIDVTVPGVRRYFTSINEDIINNPIQTCREMLVLAHIWEQIIDIPSIQVLLKFNENVKLYLGCFFSRFIDKETDKNSVAILAETLLKLFAILELVDTGYSSKNFKSFLFKESLKLVNDNINILEISQDFSRHIESTWNKNDIKSRIKEYDKNILVYLNEFIFAKNNNLGFYLGDKYDIEHIMPASGHNITSIQRDAGIKDKDDFDEIVNKLGNKILLEQEINRAISNDWFRTKVHKTRNTKFSYADSRYPIAQCLAKTYKDVEKPLWGKDDIFKATDKICERIINFVFS